ncbi:MAG: hypothetical protein K2L55_09165 [Muribaculaceae bacterium]|nr:hypothetical protein [Muribaculaceae bacterium]
MAIRTIAQLKAWFRKGLYPTESQFADWLDSYRHKQESVEMSEVSGLTTALNKKYDASEANGLKVLVDGATKAMDVISTEMKYMCEEMEQLSNTLTDRSYTLDFGHSGTVVQDVNMEAEEVVMLELRLFNVSRLWVTCGELVHHEVNPTAPEEIRIAAGSLATWEIERESDELAAVGVRCRRTGAKAEDGAENE